MKVSSFRLSRSLLVAAALALVVTGCAKKIPMEVTDLNRALGQAKDACASVYAESELAGVQSGVDTVNGLADEGKMKKARKAAEPLASRVATLQSTADSARASAKREADAALAKADASMKAAERAEAGTFAATDYGKAKAKLDEARAKAKDPCAYRDAARLAAEASALADKAATAAAAEKKRREEEEARRRAEEEARRRAEEEARRREEELRRRPPTYTVQRGDHLWKISGMEKIYGNPRMWPLIYDANRDKIRDPNLIYPGQEFKIPRGMSPEEMQQKLRKLWREMQ